MKKLAIVLAIFVSIFSVNASAFSMNECVEHATAAYSFAKNTLKMDASNAVQYAEQDIKENQTTNKTEIEICMKSVRFQYITKDGPYAN